MYMYTYMYLSLSLAIYIYIMCVYTYIYIYTYLYTDGQIYAARSWDAYWALAVPAPTLRESGRSRGRFKHKDIDI